MAELKDFLEYTDSNNFKWLGSFEDLKTLVKSTLLTEDDGEISEDGAHNAVTFKVKDVSVRFYKTTGKLKLHGTNFGLLRDGFLKLLLDKDAMSQDHQEPFDTDPTDETLLPVSSFREMLFGLKTDVLKLRETQQSRLKDWKIVLIIILKGFKILKARSKLWKLSLTHYKKKTVP